MAERLSLFATTARGTEELLARELTTLGAVKVRQDRGGVRFHANLREALRICLWTRISMRVLYPLGEFESVKGADGLYSAASEVAWEEHLSLATTFAVDSTLKDSEHAHSGFVSLKIKDAIVDRLRAKLNARPDVDTRHPDVRVVAHLAKQKLSLSLDLCGEPLHRRGYRVMGTPAPLKETLAAAILTAAEYTGAEPFLDPMCGSGTLAIEAAMIAAHRAAGLSISFSVERWPSLGREATAILRELRDEARAGERPFPHTVTGLDHDPDALAAARRNATETRLKGELRFDEADAMRLVVPEGAPGLVVTNPPYGDRLTTGGQKGMKAFYFKLGESLSQLAGWRVFILAGNTAFESAFHHRPVSRRELWNGPIECELLEYRF